MDGLCSRRGSHVVGFHDSVACWFLAVVHAWLLFERIQKSAVLGQLLLCLRQLGYTHRRTHFMAALISAYVCLVDRR